MISHTSDDIVNPFLWASIIDIIWWPRLCAQACLIIINSPQKARTLLLKLSISSRNLEKILLFTPHFICLGNIYHLPSPINMYSFVMTFFQMNTPSVVSAPCSASHHYVLKKFARWCPVIILFSPSVHPYPLSRIFPCSYFRCSNLDMKQNQPSPSITSLLWRCMQYIQS